MTEARISERYGDKKSVVIFETETVDQVGRLALRLIEEWGLVAAERQGEDSAGRARMQPMAVSAVIERAFDMAEGFWAEASKRGHVVALPNLNDVNREDDERERKEAVAHRS